ncbi:MAG: ABC transporter permease, partial [Bacteroidales bacterium]|nr:ABC transporter permease [Bacteroidales bacterium]
MLRNYFVTAIRTLLRNRTFSIINLTGLAMGLAASIMIALWVFDEMSYDTFHKNADDIYRVERHINYQGQTFFVPVTGAVYGTTILNDYPDVVNMTRVNPYVLSLEGPDKNTFSEEIHYVDTSFLQMFTFPLKQGDLKTALSQPRSLILSDIAAKRFFGNEDPMNKTLRIDWDGEMVPYKITGVLEKLPHNKHFKFEILASFATLEDEYSEERLTTWLSNYLYTYIQLRPGTDKTMMEKKLDGLVEEKILPAYKSFLSSDDESNSDNSMRLLLRNVQDIHLKAGLMWDIEVQGDINTVYVFSIIAIMILLIAAFNFVSLSTAQAGSRALEVGIRKTVGGTKKSLIWQFIGESVMFSLIAFVFALVLINIFLPYFNLLTGKNLSMQVFMIGEKFLLLLLIVIGTGFFSGIYPAFYMTAVKPITVLKGKMQQGSSRFSFRQILVVLQFSISIALIIGTVTALRQMHFMQNKDMGYNKENLIVIPVESANVISHFEAFRTDLLKKPIIKNVSGSQKVPAEREYSDSGWDTDLLKEPLMSRLFAVNFDFIDTYEIKMVAGRAFDKNQSTDKNFKVLINEAAARKIGYTDLNEAIGGKMHVDWIAKNIDSTATGTIIGVMNDFHFQSLKNKIEPLTLFLKEDWINRISIRFEPGKDQEAIAFVE